MAAPVNVDFANAIDLGALPAEVEQQVDDAGTSYDVFYKVTIPSGVNMLGAWAYGEINGSGTVYAPDLVIYNASEVLQFDGTGFNNLPIQVRVEAGALYYLKVQKNADVTPSNLTLSVLANPQEDHAAGAIVVPDDSAPFPAAVLSPDEDYTVLDFIDGFPPGEAGDILVAERVILVENSDDNNLKVYDADFDLIATLAFSGTPQIRACRGAGVFYVGSDATPPVVKTVTTAGAFGATTHTLSAISRLQGIAASNDETVLYHSRNSSGSPIARWSLTGSTALPDLVSGVALEFVWDILVLDDDTIVASHINTSTGSVKAKRYDAAGALLNTYDFGTANVFPGGTLPRLAYSPQGSTSFWVWTHPSGAEQGQSKFLEVRVSDGSILTTRKYMEYELGGYNATETETPVARFGHSFSCPFFLLPDPVFHTLPPVPPIPCCEAPCECPSESPTGSPSTAPLPSAAGPVNPPVIVPPQLLAPPYWDPACAGGGDVPSAADATDAESWVS